MSLGRWGGGAHGSQDNGSQCAALRCTPHPTPYILHTTPYTLTLLSYTLHSCTRHLKPYILHRTYTLHPTPDTATKLSVNGKLG